MSKFVSFYDSFRSILFKRENLKNIFFLAFENKQFKQEKTQKQLAEKTFF